MIFTLVDDYSINYDYAKSKCDSKEYKDALYYAFNALTLKESGEILFLIAKIYYGLKQYDLCLDFCFEVLALNAYTDEEYSDILKTISAALSKLGMYMRAFYYMTKSDGSFIEDAAIKGELDDIVENAQDFIEDVQEPVPVLHTAKEERDAYNRSTIERAVRVADMEDYKQAVTLLESLYEDGEGYDESLYFLAHLYMLLNKKEKSSELYLKISENNPQDGNCLYNLSISDEKYIPYLKERIKEFVPTVGKNTVQAIFAANNVEMYDKALEFARVLSDGDPDNRYYQLIKFTALWNVGEHESAFDTLESVLNLAPTYYPLKLLEKVPFPEKFIMPFFDFPFELTEGIAKKVARKRLLEDAIKEADFKIATVFALCSQDNYIDKYALIDKISSLSGSDSVDVLCKVLHSLKCPEDVRRAVLYALLEKRVLKKCAIVVDGIFSVIKLELPPSFDDYFPELADAYKEAFSYLAMMSSSFEDYLTKVAEKIQAHRAAFKAVNKVTDYLSGYMMMDYLKKIKFTEIEGFFSSIGFDYDIISRTYGIYEQLLNYED